MSRLSRAPFLMLVALVLTACPAAPAATPTGTPSPTVVAPTTSAPPATSVATASTSPVATATAAAATVTSAPTSRPGTATSAATPAPAVTATTAPAPTASVTPAATASPSAFSEHYEITAADKGKTFVYRLTSRITVILDSTKYPKADLKTDCTPPDAMGSISNIPAVQQPLYAVRYEGVTPGKCTITNGDFKVYVAFAMP